MELTLYHITVAISDILPYLLPIFVFRLFFMVYTVKKGNRLFLWREICAYLFTVYMGALFLQTISLRFLFTGEYYFDGRINLIPFKLIVRMLLHANIDLSMLNIWGNIIMFLPLGIFLPLLRTDFRTLQRCTMIGFAVSFFIEFMQLFTYRITDIDDLILNTAGTAIGYGLFAYFKNRHNKPFA